MKYILIKNAITDPNIHTRKLASGEVLYASQDYHECHKRIPFLMDSPENRLAFCRSNWKWKYILGTTKKSISFLDDFIKANNKEGNQSDPAHLTFAEKNFDTMGYPGYIPPGESENWSIQIFYEHNLYALNILTDQPPNSILEWFELERLIEKDLAGRILPTLHKLLDNYNFKENLTASEANELERVREEIVFQTDAFNKHLATEATAEEYFDPFNDADSDFHYLDNPNKNGVFDFDYSYEEMCKDLGISESYSIFIDFSDPDELFDELKSEIKMGIHNVYWTEDFILETMGRLVALPEDTRDKVCLDNDFDRFYKGILALVDLDEQEEEWVMEDILK